jgi:outer membrane protein OmpA-like peptidoglycan-associated protein/tetratricopeptide (TPR) repeat protein
MIKMKKIFLLSICFAPLFLWAQNIEFDKANFKDKKSELKEALENIGVGDNYYFMAPFPQYPQSIPFYERANKFNPKNAVLNFKLGFSYLHSNQKFKCMNYFEKAFALNPTVDPAIHYYLGSGAQLLKDWDKAVASFELYLKTADPKKDNVNILSATKKISECKLGKKLVAAPVRVWIDNLGREINSDAPEFGMIMNADATEMYFTSRRPTSTGGLKDESNNWYEDIYTSRFENGYWTTAENVGAPLNTKGHDAAVALSPDGTKMIIYIDDKGDGNLYESVKKNSVWGKPKKMDNDISSSYHESSAWYSPDGNKLYFVSDRPLDSQRGDAKDKDIYVASWNKNKSRWENVVRLSETVNSPYDEDGIFLHPDGKTMYFSSKGHQNIGGYDIFKTVLLADGSFKKPVNIGFPVNTPDDDVFFVVSANGKNGYITSFRQDGLGEKDLYKVTFLGDEKQPMLNAEDILLASNGTVVREKVIEQKFEIQKSEMALLKGVIRDAKTNQPLEARIELVNNENNTTIGEFTSDAVTGNFMVSLPAGKNYGIAVKVDGYLFHSENFDIPSESEYEEFSKDVFMKKVEVGEIIVLRNIFFDLAKFSLRKESQNELDRLTKLMQDNPSLRIQISGHTDSRGSAALNKELSANRAKAVVDYLITKGIDKKRLESQGFGKEQPIMTDEAIAKMKTEKAKEEAHQSNRRTEFKIISK